MTNRSPSLTESLVFSRDGLFARLVHMSPRARSAFALACATRLRALWNAYAVKYAVADGAVFNRQMDGLWDSLLRGDGPGVAGNAGALDALTAGDTDDRQESGAWDPLPTFAQEALSALVYALQAFRSGEATYAVWAGEVSYEACYQAVVGNSSRQGGGVDLEAHLVHLLVQRELRRQERDMLRLEQSFDLDALRELCAEVSTEMALTADDLIS